MFKTSVAILREQLHESQRRERVLLDLVRELNDRLANAYGNPWTLPPRPVPTMEPEPEFDPDAPILIDL